MSRHHEPGGETIVPVKKDVPSCITSSDSQMEVNNGIVKSPEASLGKRDVYTDGNASLKEKLTLVLK